MKYSLVILFVAYTQGIFHELPNVYSKEWIYQNIPFEGITIIGIPILILFIGWIILVLTPYTLFELILVINKVYQTKSFCKIIQKYV